MLTTADLEARKRRLDEHSLGMARDLAEIHKLDDPFLYLERRAYLAAIHRVWSAIEEARVVLAVAVQRLTGTPHVGAPKSSCPRPRQEGEASA